jgi:hypothetical protein
MSEAFDPEDWADEVRKQLGKDHVGPPCYILLSKETGEVQETDFLGLVAWRAADEEATRIDWTDVPLPGGKVGAVSTVFLGFDAGHRDADDRPPRLFETMVRGESIYSDKKSAAANVQEARENHARWVRVLQAEAEGKASDEAHADLGLEDLLAMLGLAIEHGRAEGNGLG